MWMEQHEAGKKATHDFLSLCTMDSFQLQDACPSNKGGGLYQLKTYDFLQPLDREEGSQEQAHPPVAHVLPGGIGTYSISHVAESGSTTVVKTEGGTCSDNAIANRAVSGGAYADPYAGVAFTRWDQNPSPVTTKDRAAAVTTKTTNGLRGHWPSPIAARSSGSSLGSLSSTRLQTGRQVQQGRKRSMERPSGFDEDEDDEDFGSGRRDVSSHKGELSVKTDGKTENVSDQRPSTPRSKHSATEQRRRSKINDRFQILREIIPHSDQKRDKASFLLEVIEYIRFLQDKVHKYEEVCPGWTEKNAKLMPWSNSQAPGDGIADPSQAIKNSSVPAGFTFSGNETGLPVAPAIHSSLQNPVESDVSPGVSYKATGNPSGFASKIGAAPAPQPNLYATARRETGVIQLQPLVSDSDNMASQSRPQWLRPTCPAECTVPGDSNDREELAIDEGTISVSSAYSQGLLTSLSRSLQNSGINLSQASISVQINLGKRATNKRRTATSTMSSAKDHDDPSSGNRLIGHSRVGSTGEESEQASKRHKSDPS